MNTCKLAMGTLVCAKCGKAQPVTEYDQRFIGTGRKLTCAGCRGVANEATKWQDSWVRHRGTNAAMAESVARIAAENEARERAIAREEQREQRLWARAEKVWEELRGRGFSDDEIDVIWHIHVSLREVSIPWSEIKRRYLAITPPYTPTSSRKRASYTLREAVYQEQGGRCFYCERALLPLSVWKRGSPDGRSVIDQMRQENPFAWFEDGIPELDHKIPVSRGGELTRENLCYACRKCNQLKLDRTASEFALYPHDPITGLELGIGQVYGGVQVEARGYDEFDALSCSASRRRFPEL